MVSSLLTSILSSLLTSVLSSLLTSILSSLLTRILSSLLTSIPSGLLNSILKSLLTSILSDLLTSILSSLLTIVPTLSHLLPDHKKKFKTKVIKDNHNPEWNENFVFESLKIDDIQNNKVIEITVWNSPKGSKKDKLIGGLRLGPRPQHEKQLSYMDSSENELSHWMSIVNTPGECVEQLHTLRHSMDAHPIVLSPALSLGNAVINLLTLVNLVIIMFGIQCLYECQGRKLFTRYKCL